MNDLKQKTTDNYRESFFNYVQARITFNGLLIATSVGILAVTNENEFVKTSSIGATLILLAGSFPLISLFNSFVKLYKYIIVLIEKTNNENRMPTRSEEKIGENLSIKEYDLNNHRIVSAQISTYIGILLIAMSLIAHSFGFK